MNSSSIIASGKLIPSFKDILNMFGLFILIMLTDVFFRAPSVSEAIKYLNKIFSYSIINYPKEVIDSNNIMTVVLLVFFITIEWFNREKKHDFEISKYNILVRWFLYFFILLLILFFGKSSESFIYFQF